MSTIIAGKYEVLSELGRGGMGLVYRVRHRDLGRIYALKVLRAELAEDTDLVARFRHEAQVMARLRHPHIVQVFDIDRDGDLHYFVMEYVEGHGLDRLLRERGALPLEQVTAIGTQVAQALAYAHACEPAVVHRDIKAANILIEDGSGRVVVTDFGIAKLLDEQHTRHTRTGMFLGTLRYSAPEQLRGDADVDGRADVYALGMLLYEMAAGTPFFAGLSDHQLVGKLLYDRTENVPDFECEVPEAFRRTVAKAIAKDRAQRYPTAVALLADLERSEPSTVPVPVAAAAPVAATPRRALKRGTAIAALMLPVLAIWFWAQPRPPDPPAENARDANPPPTAIDTANEQARQPDAPVPAQTTPTPAERPALPVSPPDAQVTLGACGTQTFSVQGPPQARYAWWVDAQRRQEAGSQLVFSADRPGAHEIRVETTDEGGTASHVWAVQVEPSRASDEQVARWLDEYRQALERKDIAKLRSLGFVHTDQQAESLRSALQPRQKYGVSVHSVQAEALEGEVRLSFRQVDRWYDPATYSSVVDNSAHTVTLIRSGCAELAAR